MAFARKSIFSLNTTRQAGPTGGSCPAIAQVGSCSAIDGSSTIRLSRYMRAVDRPAQCSVRRPGASVAIRQLGRRGIYLRDLTYFPPAGGYGSHPLIWNLTSWVPATRRELGLLLAAYPFSMPGLFPNAQLMRERDCRC